jgi:branched-chain amino acid transport system ATP-binding protein
MTTDRSPGNPLLDVLGVTCGYGGGAVINDICLRIMPGELICLIGPNGAGKSTLIKAIMGILKPSAGSVRFDGEELSGVATYARVVRGLALVPEGRGVLPGLSVEDNLLMGGYTSRASGDLDGRIDEMMRTFPILAARRTQTAGTLSGGEQQMLVIARALLGRPRLLILDEPSLGLAPLIVRQIFQIISDLHNSGLAILLVEQNARMALKISERGCVMESGRFVLEDQAGNLRTNELVKRIYLGSE